MQISLLELIDMTPQLMRERLVFLDLTESDAQYAELLQREVIAIYVEDIIEQFYSKLLAQPPVVHALATFNLAQVKISQRAYLLNLGINFWTSDYFEERLHIGITHVRANIQPALYQCAYRLMQQILIDHIPAQHSQYKQLLTFIIKITALDMSLAIEAYEKGVTDSLQRALDNLEREKLNLKDQVATDALTGVLSRKAILDMLESKLDKLMPPKPVAVLMADIDFFKKINDSYGHVTGDAVLKDVALRMRSAIRSVNSLGRYGGEEFLLVLNNTNLAQACIVAERIREKVASQPFAVNQNQIQVTISIGIASANVGEPIVSVIERADAALYDAKNQGRNRVVASEV